jgi:hypothetical protein
MHRLPHSARAKAGQGFRLALQAVNIVFEPIAGNRKLWIFDGASRHLIEQIFNGDLKNLDVLLAGKATALPSRRAALTRRNKERSARTRPPGEEKYVPMGFGFSIR